MQKLFASRNRGYYDRYMQRGIIQPVLALGILLLVSLGFYYFYQNLNLKNNPPVAQQKWNLPKLNQTYTDPNLSFSFEYPTSLTLKEDTEEAFNQRGGGNFRKNFKGYVGYEPGKFVSGVVVLDGSESYDVNPFTIWVFENPNDLTIDAWHHDYWYYPFVWGDFTAGGKFDLAPKDEATVSGQIGKSRVIDYRVGKPKFIYLPKDKKMYLFRVIGSDGEKILQSFKFLD